jgi:hypothetical protein
MPATTHAHAAPVISHNRSRQRPFLDGDEVVICNNQFIY